MKNDAAYRAAPHQRYFGRLLHALDRRQVKGSHVGVCVAWPNPSDALESLLNLSLLSLKLRSDFCMFGASSVLRNSFLVNCIRFSSGS